MLFDARERRTALRDAATSKLGSEQLTSHEVLRGLPDGSQGLMRRARTGRQPRLLKGRQGSQSAFGGGYLKAGQEQPRAAAKNQEHR